MEGIEIQDDEMVFEEALRQALEKEGHEVIYRSVDRVAAALEEVRSTKRRRKRPGSGSVSASLTEQLLEKSRLRERRRERRDLLQNGVFVHVTSRIHLQRKLLREDEVKAILARKCRHYARVCKIELHHYCIMDNHLHLVLRICSESSALDRMMADIKREFTKEYKHWFNHVHRKTIKYRSEKLGRGTLWDGPYTCEIIEDMPQLAAASFYVEANRLKVIARSAIVELTRAPRLLEMEQGRLDEEYESLLRLVRSYGFQSAHFYLDGCEGSDPYLTDGTDGVWASPEEVQKWWKRPASELPKGWKRVWYGGTRAILKPTPESARRYPISPLWNALGSTPEWRAFTFGRLLMGACWRARRALQSPPVDHAHGDDSIVGARAIP